MTKCKNCSKLQNKGEDVPKREYSFLSESGKTSGDSEDEGQDSESGVDGNEGGAETSGSLVTDQQQEEAEEADCVLENNSKWG